MTTKYELSLRCRVDAVAEAIHDVCMVPSPTWMDNPRNAEFWRGLARAAIAAIHAVST